MTPEEKDELLHLLFLAEVPEIMVGRVGPGDGIVAYGLVKNGNVQFSAASPRAGVLLDQLLSGKASS